MDPVINAVRDFLLEIIEYCEKNFPQVGLELGFVGYRDVDSGRRNRYESIPFMSNIEEFKRQFIAACDCTGGGDEAEDVLGGMQKALELNWDHNNTNVKVLVHCGDSPHHGKLFHDPSINDIHDGYTELQDQPRPYTDILADFADYHIDYTFAQIKSHRRDEFTTNRMLTLFSDAYNSFPSRKSDFKAEPMYNFTAKDLFASVRTSLSSSIQSFMKSVKSPPAAANVEYATVVAVPVAGGASMASPPPIATALDSLLKNVTAKDLPRAPDRSTNSVSIGGIRPPSAPSLPGGVAAGSDAAAEDNEKRKLQARIEELERRNQPRGCCLLM
jgi:hypothetical protein